MDSKYTFYLIPSELHIGSASEWIGSQNRLVLGGTYYYLAENIRTARRFIASLKTGLPINELHLQILDKDTDAHGLEKLIENIPVGSKIGIISEAGCPGVADPGAIAVAWAHQHGHDVLPLVGPSAILLALMGSGFGGQEFSFNGYLPIERNARTAAIGALEHKAQLGQTQIFMETPYRNQTLLDELLAHLKPKTLLCIAAGLHSPNQLVRTLSITAWQKQKPMLHKIPTIFLLGK